MSSDHRRRETRDVYRPGPSRQNYGRDEEEYGVRFENNPTRRHQRDNYRVQNNNDNRRKYLNDDDLRHKLEAMRINNYERNERDEYEKPKNNNKKPPQERTGNKNKGKGNHIKNTVDFKPSYDAPDMRILAATPGRSKYEKKLSSKDVLVVSDLFGDESDLTIYKTLLDEIENSVEDSKSLWLPWHGSSHVIADDSTRWKEQCPTFTKVVDKIAEYFGMDVKATRLNLYKDSTQWKPFHHDAAAIKPKVAETQNFTAAVSFGKERDAAFEHAATKTKIYMPQPNNTVYTFGKDVNIEWKHGVPQISPEKLDDMGRISIIVWGWVDQIEL